MQSYGTCNCAALVELRLIAALAPYLTIVATVDFNAWFDEKQLLSTTELRDTNRNY